MVFAQRTAHQHHATTRACLGGAMFRRSQPYTTTTPPPELVSVERCFDAADRVPTLQHSLVRLSNWFFAQKQSLGTFQYLTAFQHA